MSDHRVAPLEIEGLTKAFGVGFLATRRKPALSELSLRMEPGEILGYLGPNGAGKTTTLKILMGHVAADAGGARILGEPLASPKWRARAGYLPEQPYFYDYLTPAEYLDYVGRLLDLPGRLRRERARQLIEKVGLARWFTVPMRRFSKGMLQRVGIAQALINEPEIVFLDEPMSGLDPIGRHMVRDVILDLKRRGCAVLFSTHILPDAEALCDRVALLRAGRLVKVGRLDEILGQDISHFEILLRRADGADLDGVPGLRVRESLGERWRLEIDEAALTQAIQTLAGAGAQILSVQPVRPSLEDFFFSQMGGTGKQETWSVGD